MFKFFAIFFYIITIVPSSIHSFEELSIDIAIKEEQPNGTLLLDLRSYLPSLNDSSHSYLIKFLRPCSPHIYFDPQSRFLLRTTTIDREQLCPRESNCSFTCQLFYQKQQITLIKLKINIQDINDHPLQFPKHFYSYELNQDVSFNYRLQIEQAQDQDSSSFSSNFIYHLNISSSDQQDFPFELHFDRDNHLLELIIIGKVYFNRTYLFHLIVHENDNQQGEVEEEEDQCLIEIKIISNQQKSSSPPEFPLKLYKFTVTNLNHTFIGQVQVRHSDEEQQKIYYRLIPAIEQHRNLFYINQTTAEIFFKKQQDKFLFDEVYRMFVEGFYSNYLSTLTTVEIHFNLTATNTTSSSSPSIRLEENSDFIEILVPKLFQNNSSSNQIFLKENFSVPLTLLQLFISSSRSSATSLQATSSSIDFNRYFHVKQLEDDDGDDQQQSFELILIQPFDYESIQKLFLDFTFTRSHSDKKRSLELIIENMNDCPPYFNQTTFHFSLQENNKYPFLLHTFEAFDQDHLDAIIYEIQTSDEHIFVINSTTGQLWITKSLDREEQNNYSFVVCAFDQLFRTCSPIFIDVLDENDNICHFNSSSSSSSLTLTINENLPSNTFLTQIQAFDPDYEQNGTLQYHFSSPTSYLTLDPITGVIRTTSTSFDYELMQTYSILVLACDNIHSFPSLCCYLQLYIHLVDMDDNLPYFIYPSSVDDLLIVDYTNGTMPRLKVFDNDIDLKNRLINYTIVGGSLSSLLTIDSLSGQLHLLSTYKLPLYGTLLVSLSSHPHIELTLLIHDNQTDTQHFLVSYQQQRRQERQRGKGEQSSFLSPLFSLVSSISLGILIVIVAMICLIIYFLRQKVKHDDDRLMNTPSTTTLSGRSLSANRKMYETYYSFGDSVVNGDVIHL